ncbi:hypothetical protein CRG98_025980, partial [Punica granatum]
RRKKNSRGGCRGEMGVVAGLLVAGKFRERDVGYRRESELSKNFDAMVVGENLDGRDEAAGIVQKVIPLSRGVTAEGKEDGVWEKRKRGRGCLYSILFCWSRRNRAGVKQKEQRCDQWFLRMTRASKIFLNFP